VTTLWGLADAHERMEAEVASLVGGCEGFVAFRWLHYKSFMFGFITLVGGAMLTDFHCFLTNPKNKQHFICSSRLKQTLTQLLGLVLLSVVGSIEVGSCVHSGLDFFLGMSFVG
jgi:hypothetical protein